MDMSTYTPDIHASTTDPTLGSSPVQHGRAIRFGYWMLVDWALIKMGGAGFDRGSGSYRVDFSTANIYSDPGFTGDEHVTSGWGNYKMNNGSPSRYRAHPSDALTSGTPDQHGLNHDNNSSGTTFDNAPELWIGSDTLSVFRSIMLDPPDTGHGGPVL
jgi:hypothetical protein